MHVAQGADISRVPTSHRSTYLWSVFYMFGSGWRIQYEYWTRYMASNVEQKGVIMHENCSKGPGLIDCS